MTRYRTVEAGGHRVFYREAGDRAHPTLLLLHGFPSSSHMFRDLIPHLADRFHLVAPDLPGFGHTGSPDGFAYTFDNLAKVVQGFTDAVGLGRYALYVFDYGAPVGFRLALARPDRVTAVVTQNGNAYEEGLSENWDPIQRYWREPTAANRDALRSPGTSRWRRTTSGSLQRCVTSSDGSFPSDPSNGSLRSPDRKAVRRPLAGGSVARRVPTATRPGTDGGRLWDRVIGVGAVREVAGDDPVVLGPALGRAVLAEVRGPAAENHDGLAGGFVEAVRGDAGFGHGA
jgi:pimeloyl-ACP methyl ester carboxylesterase